MRIINVIFIMGGILESVESFPIYEEQLSNDVIKEAEKEFIRVINEYYDFEDDENRDEIIATAIEDGYLEMSGGEDDLYLIWSNVNE